MSNKYAEELAAEKKLIEESNPLLKIKDFKEKQENKGTRSVPFTTKKDKHNNYFNLILSTDFEDLEMEIKGLMWGKEINEETGKTELIMMRNPNHYLSEDGALTILGLIKPHLSVGVKLGIMTREEFCQLQEIIRKTVGSFVQNNLYSLGMDSESKQRNAAPLLNMILATIRQEYSRSIAGLENERSHGDIKLSGDLDFGMNDPYSFGKGGFGGGKGGGFGLKDLKN